MRRTYHIGTLLLVLAWGSFAATPDLSAEELIFATYPFGDAALIYQAFTPLVTYLEAETGLDLRLVVTRNYDELSRRLVDDSVDFAWIGSANYVKTRKSLPGVIYLATYREWDTEGTTVRPYYQAVILTLADSAYRTLSDLAGAKFGFTSPDSTSGYAYPRMILDRNGIDPEQFFDSVFFLGKHTNVIGALLAGSIDAGAVSDGTYYNARREYGEVFRVIELSELIPLDAIVAAPHVAASNRAAMIKALLSIGEMHPVNDAIRDSIGWPAAGFEVRSDAFYDSVEQALGVLSGP